MVTMLSISIIIVKEFNLISHTNSPFSDEQTLPLTVTEETNNNNGNNNDDSGNNDNNNSGNDNNCSSNNTMYQRSNQQHTKMLAQKTQAAKKIKPVMSN